MPRYYQNKTHQSFQKAPEDSEYVHKFIPKKDNNKMQNQGPYRVPKNYQRSQELALVQELPDSEPEQRRKLFIGGLSYESVLKIFKYSYLKALFVSWNNIE